MTDEEIKLQNALTTTFLANMAFLSEYDNDLFQRVEKLSRMIETGEYKERYELEFIKENGDFDIFDNQTKRYLYDRNPKKINDNLIKEVQKDGKKAIFNVEGYFKHKNIPTLDLNYKFQGEYSSLSHKYMKEYTDALKDYLDYGRIRTYKEIKKFVFFGTFLGRHIPKIAEKIDSLIYLVIEVNLEIFRLSLFTVDYKILAKNNGVIFSIMDDSTELEKKMELFINIGNLENYLLKFSILGTIETDIYDKFISYVFSRKPSSYDFARYLYAYINRTTNTIKDKHRFLLFNKIKDNLNILKDLPVLYLAAGPSLDENIDWIHENQNKFFIVTIGSVYKKLINKGIKIDLVTTLDEQKWLKRSQFPDEIIKKTDQNTVFMASAFSNILILDSLKNKNLYIFETIEPFFDNNYCFDGNSIGEITVDIILNLNANNIYLIGLDLSLNQETGETHSTESASGIDIIDINKERDLEKIDYKSIVKIKGNMQEEIKTIEKYFSSIKHLEKKLDNKGKNVRIYNLSKTGAFFRGTIPLSIESIDIKAFKTLDKNSLNFNKHINSFSQIGLSNSEKNLHRLNIEFLENIIKKDLNIIEEYDFKNYKELNESILQILNKIKLHEDIMTFYQVIFNYYEIVVPYLNYHFNDIKVNQEYKKVKKIKDIFINHLENMINDYIVCIKRIL